MIYFWVTLFTLIVSSVSYSMHMDAFLYIQQQKKIAEEQAVLEYMITASKYLKTVKDNNKEACLNFNKCKDLLREELKKNYYMDNNIDHCIYHGNIITYYKSNNKFYNFVLDLYKDYGVKDLKYIDYGSQAQCKTSNQGVFIQQSY